MALVASSPSSSSAPSDPTATLQAALSDFESVLTTEQKQQYHAQVQQFNQQKPDASSVIQFVAQLDAANHAKSRSSVSNRLCTFLDAIQQFTGIVNTFVSSNPVIAALVWGGIKVTILIASNFTSFDKITSIIMTIGQLSPIFRDFSHLYADSTALQKALCDYHAIVIRLVTRFVQILPRTVITSLLASVLSSFDSEFRPFQDELAQASRVVKWQISLAAKQAAQASTKLLELESKENSKHRRLARLLASDIKAEHEAAQRLRSQKSLRRAAKMRVEIKDQLSTTSYQTSWKQAQKQRLLGTSDWFRDHPDFQSWEACPSTATLWCSGRMGSGKTVLVSNIISHFYLSIQPGNIVAFHFCRSDNSASLLARNVLGTLSCQILDTYIANASESQLQDLHQACRNLSTDDVVDLLLSHLDKNKKYYIVIDGIDECATDQIDELVKAMAKLYNSQDQVIKTIYSSRPELEHQLFSSIGPKFRLSLSKTVINADIERYIDIKLDQCLEENKFKLTNPETIFKIRNCLFAEHDGLLLFVQLWIEELCLFGTENAVLQALDNPPKKISDIFAIRLRRVKDHHLAADALNMLRYCGCTKRPLTVNEFSELLGISTEHTSLDRASIPQNMSQIVAACYGLVYVEEEELTVHYVHQSLKHHLFTDNGSKEFDECGIDVHLGNLCLTYLNFNDFKRSLTKVNASAHKLVAPIELGLASIRDSSSTVNDVARKLLNARRKTKQLTTAELSRRTEDIIGEAESTRLKAEMQSRPYYLLEYVQSQWLWHSLKFDKDSKLWHRFSAYVHGENYLAKRPWIQDDDTRQKTDIALSSTACLKWALAHSHDSILLYIVLSGPPQPMVENFFDIFCYAVKARNQRLTLEVMTCLKPIGMSIAELGLCLAAQYGYEDVVDFFIHAGARVDDFAPSRDHTALYYASQAGHLAVVERLLSANAKANTESVEEGAMYAAAREGHIAVVERLLIAGARIEDEPPFPSGSVLRAASAGGHLAIVEHLLQAGANVNFNHHHNALASKTAIHAAAAKGHLAVVERLLAAGAIVVDDPKSMLWSVLRAAAAQGWSAVVERLLDNLDSSYTHVEYAFEVAIENSHFDVAKLLVALASGSQNVSRYHFDLEGALRDSAGAGQLEAVTILLDAGVNVNVRYSHVPYRLFRSKQPYEIAYTALHAAAAGGHSAIVSALLNAGAGVNAINYLESTAATALQAAAGEGHSTVVSALLNAGADVNAANRVGWNALVYAIKARDHPTISLLIRAGAETQHLESKRYLSELGFETLEQSASRARS